MQKNIMLAYWELERSTGWAPTFVNQVEMD